MIATASLCVELMIIITTMKHTKLTKLSLIFVMHIHKDVHM